jgi:rare lipoprotein A
LADEARSPATTALAACAVAVAVLLAGCASGTRSGGGVASGRDGPGTNIPSDLDRVPDAEPRIEAIRSSGGTSKPYTVLGRGYQPITDDRPFRESGLASWYGRKFHAASTSSGEPYDMYAMTAAHKTLPLPSYVRVRNPANGREVIVRVNDRGPFVDGRVIDLSYTAALKLDLLRGVAPVEIERITNEDVRTGAWRRDSGTAYAAAASPAPAPPPMRAAAAPVPVPSAWVAPVAMSAPAASTMAVVPQTPMAPAASHRAGRASCRGAGSRSAATSHRGHRPCAAGAHRSAGTCIRGAHRLCRLPQPWRVTGCSSVPSANAMARRAC